MGWLPRDIRLLADALGAHYSYKRHSGCAHVRMCNEASMAGCCVTGKGGGDLLAA